MGFGSFFCWTLAFAILCVVSGLKPIKKHITQKQIAETIHRYSNQSLKADYVVAHNRLIPPSNSEDDMSISEQNGGNVILSLDIHDFDNRTEYTSGVDVLSTGYRVRYIGIYYVYVSVYFNSTPACGRSEVEEPLFVVVGSRLDNQQQQPNVLLKSWHTCCVSCGAHQADFTSTRGNHTVLFAGDLIQVMVARETVDRVIFVGESTHFGLFSETDLKFY